MIRRSELKSGKPLQRGKRLAARSAKRSALMAEGGARAALNQELVISPRLCELGAEFRSAGFDVCTGRAVCWHEKRKRSSAGSIVDRGNLMASCGPCNDLVEREPAVAHRLGFVVRAGEPGWDEASVRNDAVSEAVVGQS